MWTMAVVPRHLAAAATRTLVAATHHTAQGALTANCEVKSDKFAFPLSCTNSDYSYLL